MSGELFSYVDIEAWFTPSPYTRWQLWPVCPSFIPVPIHGSCAASGGAVSSLSD